MKRKRVYAVPVFREHFLQIFLAWARYTRRGGSFDTKHTFLAPEMAELRIFISHCKTRFVSQYNAISIQTASQRLLTQRRFRISDPSPGS